MTPLGAVLFDLDGTLTDSRSASALRADTAFERLSATTRSRLSAAPHRDLNWIVGPPLRDSFGKLAGVGNARL